MNKSLEQFNRLVAVMESYEIFQKDDDVDQELQKLKLILDPVQPVPWFKAIYNPFTRHLVVLYGDVISEHYFKDKDEWVKVSYKGDENDPRYLHIQLDYDETAQLIFYPRVDGSEELNEELSSSYNSISGSEEHIKIVMNDYEWDVQISRMFPHHSNHESFYLTHFTVGQCKEILKNKKL